MVIMDFFYTQGSLETGVVARHAGLHGQGPGMAKSQRDTWGELQERMRKSRQVDVLSEFRVEE